MRLNERLDLSDRRVRMLFAKHGISPSQTSDPYAIVPLAAYVALLEDTADLIGDPLLGAAMGKTYRPADLGPVGILFSLSPTLRVAFERLSRLLPAFQAQTSVALLNDGENAAWVYKVSNARIWPRRQDAEYAMSATCAMARIICGPNWRPREIRFEHDAPTDPAVTKSLRKLLGGPISFGHSINALILSAEDVDRVRHVEDAGLTTILEHHIADLAGDDALAPPSVGQAVRTVLDINLGHTPISAGMVAERLGVPVRTLQRRLADEGLSLRQLIETHRLTVAEQRLKQGGTPIGRLAEMLGYSDAASFSRAYRAWCGHPPTADRR
ncbi:MAG: AraC family transcriptional regulator [Caulobacter sp.]|nr:AraC family transcriptional regulator [Caulobacter sp.]